MSATPQKSVPPEDLITFIEELKRQWMSTIDALVDPLMMVQEDYTIYKANLALAKIAGIDIKQVTGRKCYQVFADRDSPCPNCKMQESSTTKKPQQYELNHVRGNQFFEVSSQPLLNSSGEVDGVVQVYRDRTEARKLREQLLQSEKLSSIGLLAGGIAHELNNPIGGVMIFAEMLLKQLSPGSQEFQDAEEIKTAAERCKNIITGLLDFARSNPTKKGKELDHVKVSDTIKEALKFAQMAIGAQNYHIEASWLDSEPLVAADRNKLIQVFLNLIQNAFHAMKDGGTLSLRNEIKQRESTSWLITEIQDSGDGIPKSLQGKIFDPFFTTKEPGEGTGLGLAIVYGILQDFGGKIDFESSPKSGSIFRVSLPVVNSPIKLKEDT